MVAGMPACPSQTIAVMVQKRAPRPTSLVLRDGRRHTTDGVTVERGFAGRGPWILVSGAHVDVAEVEALEEADGSVVLVAFDAPAASGELDELRLGMGNGFHRDFMINGDSLGAWRVGERVGGEGVGVVSVLDGFADTQRRAAQRQLLLRDPSPLPSGRVPLYGCVCGDLGCGCLAVRIERQGDHVIWSDFSVDAALFVEDDSPREPGSAAHLGTFRFDWTAYVTAIGGA